MRDEERLESGIDEGGEGGGEVGCGMRLDPGRRVRLGRIDDRMAEASRHALPAAVDLLDVPPDDLLLEERVRHLHRARAGEEHAREEDVRETDEEEEEPDPARRPWWWRRGWSLASLRWFLTPRGRAGVLSHRAIWRHPSQSTRPGRDVPDMDLPGERDAHLGRKVRSLVRETEPVVHLEQRVRRELPLDLDDPSHFVLLALDSQDRAPSRGETLQVLERVLAERDLSLVRLVRNGCARGERAEMETARQPEPLNQLPVLRPDQLPVLLEGEHGLEIAPELGAAVGLLPPTPSQLRLRVTES